MAEAITAPAQKKQPKKPKEVRVYHDHTPSDGPLYGNTFAAVLLEVVGNIAKVRLGLSFVNERAHEREGKMHFDHFNRQIGRDIAIGRAKCPRSIDHNGKPIRLRFDVQVPCGPEGQFHWVDALTALLKEYEGKLSTDSYHNYVLYNRIAMSRDRMQERVRKMEAARQANRGDASPVSPS